MNPATPDLVFTGGTVVTMDPSRPVLSPGWVSVSGERVSGIGVGVPPPGKRTVDCRGDMVLPGLVNTHAHLLGTFVRGFGGDRTTTVDAGPARSTATLRMVMDEEDAYAVARLALTEMQLSGVTTTTDSQLALRGRELQADGTLRALHESGVQAVFYRSSLDRTEFFPVETHDSADWACAQFDRLHSAWAGPRLTMGIEPMALHRVSDQLLQALVELAGDRKAPLSVHGPYSPAAARHAGDRWGRTVVEKLDQVGALGPWLLLAHPVVVSETDIEMLSRKDVAVSVCAVGNKLIGVGPAPVPDLLAAGVRTGLGLDQPNDGHDMFQLMKMTLLAQRGGPDGLWGTPEMMLELATRGGGQALGREAGSIKPGGWADIVVVDGSHPCLQPQPARFSNLVLACGPQVIRSVYTRGVPTVDRGRHLVWDMEETVAAVNEAMKRCLKRSGVDRPKYTTA